MASGDCHLRKSAAFCQQYPHLESQPTSHCGIHSRASAAVAEPATEAEDEANKKRWEESGGSTGSSDEWCAAAWLIITSTDTAHSLSQKLSVACSLDKHAHPVCQPQDLTVASSRSTKANFAPHCCVTKLLHDCTYAHMQEVDTELGRDHAGDRRRLVPAQPVGRGAPRTLG